MLISRRKPRSSRPHARVGIVAPSFISHVITGLVKMNDAVHAVKYALNRVGRAKPLRGGSQLKVQRRSGARCG